MSEPTLVRTADTSAAPPRKRYFRVLTPNPEFKGQRFGFEFVNGECVLPENAVFYLRKGQSTEPTPVEVLPLFERELHYTVEEIPADEHPLPRSTRERLLNL